MSLNKDLQIIASDKKLELSYLENIAKQFGAPLVEVSEILDKYKSIKVTNEKQKDDMAEARKLRLALRKTRTSVENTRKELKDEHLKAGRAIDAVANYVKDNIVPAEKYLQEQEDFVKIKEEREKAERKAERLEALAKYADNPNASSELYNLDDMSDEQFAVVIARLEKEEAERKAAEEAEAKRLAQEEADRIKREKELATENERLKKEAEAREAELGKEREIERKKREAEEKIREEQLAKERAEREAKETELAKQAEEERKKREAIEAEQRAKAEAEAKAKAEAERAEREALLAPDKEKMLQFAKGLAVVRTEKIPAMKSLKASETMQAVALKLAAIELFIGKAVKGMK